MTPIDKAIAALEGARIELWDEWHSHMSESGFNADPTIEDIDSAITELKAYTAQSVDAEVIQELILSNTLLFCLHALEIDDYKKNVLANQISKSRAAIARAEGRG